MKTKKSTRALAIIYAVLMFIFIYIPTVVMMIYSFNEQSANKWWTGFTTDWYKKLFSGSQLWDYFTLSLRISLTATLIVVVIGTLGAMGLSRHRFFGKNALTFSVYIPMIVPGVVFSIAIMSLLALMGVQKGVWSVVLGNVILMLPYMILTVQTRFSGFDTSIEEASMDLGANGFTTFFRITLPNILPGIFTGALLSFALTLDDVVMADFLAGTGNMTFPLKVYNSVKRGVSPEINALQSIFAGLIMIGVIVYLIVDYRKTKAAKEAEELAFVESDTDTTFSVGVADSI